MMIAAIWEHNGCDTLLYARDYPGAFARGVNLEIALGKLPCDAASFCLWAHWDLPQDSSCVVVQEKPSDLAIRDADSDVIFDSEMDPMTWEEYEILRHLALRSAADFLALYRSIPNPDQSILLPRSTFYGERPRTAREMLTHTQSVNDYYFGEIHVDADHTGDILSCRQRAFSTLEGIPDFLTRPVEKGSYGEFWSLRKVLRRFLWHDRIHAKAMYRMACQTFGADAVPDIFCFGGLK
ncbi:MAG: hypothetical protein E7464_07855 [Ruminococcaceae bacterium]|nr:hypothetical protein [Oscillospiraceae bacterium]